MSITMPEPISVSLQIPLSWKEKIDRLAGERQISASQILSEAIALYLGTTKENQEERFKALEGEINGLKQVTSQLSAAIARLQYQTLPVSTGLSDTEILPPDSDNWVDDEPDEILYDFIKS